MAAAWLAVAIVAGLMGSSLVSATGVICSVVLLASNPPPR